MDISRSGYKFVFLTADKLLDFYAQDEHLFHTIARRNKKKRRDLIKNLKLALPHFLLNGRRDELEEILLMLASLTLTKSSKLDGTLKKMLRTFMRQDRLQVELGLLDHWCHVVLVDLILHFLSELNIDSFPPGNGASTGTGHPRPNGELLGRRTEFQELPYAEKEYHCSKVFSQKLQIQHRKEDCRNCPLCKDSTSNIVIEQISPNELSSRYFLDPSLTIAALFHDCAYPVSSKAQEAIGNKLEELVGQYNKALKNKFLSPVFDGKLIKFQETLPDSAEFIDFLSKFNFNNKKGDKGNYLRKMCEEGLSNLDHGMLSGFFLYRQREKVYKSIQEGEGFKELLINNPSSNIDEKIIKDSVEALKKFYIDSAIHAISLHNLELKPSFITWNLNPVLVLLKIADLMSYFDRPEIEGTEETYRIAPRIEGLYFGIRKPKNNEVDLLIVYDYRNITISQNTKSSVKTGFKELGTDWLKLRVLLLLKDDSLDGRYNGMQWKWTS